MSKSSPPSTYLLCIVAVSLYGSVKGASRYEATPITGNYVRTRRSCQNNGGDLATFDSYGDVYKIYDECDSTGHPGGGCFVGFNDIQQLNTWRWIDNTPFNGFSWVSGGMNGLETSDYDRCGAVHMSYSRYAPMEDYACDFIACHGICEYPVAMCDCFSTSLYDTARYTFPGGQAQCYRYRFNGCDDIDTIRIGLGNNPNTECGFRLSDAYVPVSSVPRISQPSGVRVQLVSGGDVPLEDRGIVVTGLDDNDLFWLCFRASMVRGTREIGRIEYDDGEDNDLCSIRNGLPDFCPGSPSGKGSNNAMVNMEGMDTVETVGTVNKEPVDLMTLMWTAVISCIVSIVVVMSAYILCIKPSNKTQVYDKLVLESSAEKDEI